MDTTTTASISNESSPRNEMDALLQQALQLSNLNDSYMDRQNLETVANDDNGNANDAIINKIVSLESKLKQIENENQQYREEIDKLKFDLEMTCKAVDTLGKGLNKFEQYNCRENIEIDGIPDSVRNDELEAVVINILRRIGVHHLEEWEIVACHRL